MPLNPQKIITLMEAKQITRAELARRTGIKAPHITRLLSGERSDPTLSTVERVAAALRCSISRLID